MIGATIDGFLLEAFLGQPGGFGTAYKASKDGQVYVVKVLHPQMLATPELQERFRREARSLQKVNHPGVVKYVHHGEALLGNSRVHFLVMPYEPGETMADYIARKPRIDEPEVVAMILPIIDALGAIHRAGIVHCDLKPSNIYLRADGRPLILDFGVVKLLDYTTITENGHPRSWRYVAPEQPFDTFDTRADLYSMGVIMYELLTGTMIFPMDVPPLEFMRRIKEDLPDLPSHRYAGVTPAIENVVMRLLEKQPYKRYGDVVELKGAIEDAVRLGNQPAPGQIDTGVGPRFYVHAQFNESGPLGTFLTSQRSVNGLIYGAAQAHMSSGPIDLAVSAGVSVIVDPETHRLARSDFSRTKGLVALPYAKDSVTPLQPEHLMAVNDYQTLARKVIDHQLCLRSDILVAPYFHFAEMKSEWVGRNIKLLAEARLHADNVGNGRPLWAVISTDVELLCSEAAQQELLNLYTRTRVEGFLFLVNFDEQTANAAQIYQYALTLLRFRSTRRSVIAGRVGSLGLGLCAAGITGFSSGMTTLENFSFSYYTDRSKMNGGPPQRYYLARLLQNVTVDQARMILAGPHGSKYSCVCPACIGSLDDRLDWSSARAHFLYARNAQLSELMRVPDEQRLGRFMNWVDDARAEAHALSITGLKAKFDHFAVWLDALRQIAQSQRAA